MVGGATPVLNRQRARVAALVGLVAALVLYGAVAEQLWDLPSAADLAFVALVVMPGFMALIWLALPAARAQNSWAALGAAVIAGATAGGLTLIGADAAANVAKFGCFALLGLWFLSLFEELWWVALVAMLVPWVDIWSVAAGPTNYVIEEQPGFFEGISVGFPIPGELSTVYLGPPDVIFFALFLATADRFRLRVAWTWIGMTAFLALTLLLVWKWDVGLPALPAVCLGFLAPNADLLWHHVGEVWRQRREAPESK